MRGPEPVPELVLVPALVPALGLELVSLPMPLPQRQKSPRAAVVPASERFHLRSIQIHRDSIAAVVVVVVAVAVAIAAADVPYAALVYGMRRYRVPIPLQH